MRNDDLAPLLAAGSGGSELGFHSGVVRYWDSLAGHNTIAVDGALIDDVPILNTSDAIQLEAGDVVALIRFRHSYFVMGRITVPGSPAFASAAVAFDGVGQFESNISVGTSSNAKATVSITGPAWADTAVLFASVYCSIGNTTGAKRIVYLTSAYDGVNPGSEQYAHIPNNSVGNIANSQTQFLTKADRGSFADTPITVDCKIRADAFIAADPSSVCSVHALAVFSSSR